MAKKNSFDQGYDETEKELEKLEKKIKSEYKKASQEMAQKYKDYMDKYNSDVKKQEELMKAGKITLEEFNNWKLRKLGMGEHWQEMRDTLSEDLINADKIAKKMVQGGMADVYAINHNFTTYQIMHDGKLSYSFSLYDKSTVERLIKENPKLLPNPSEATKEKIKNGELQRWNKRKIQSSLTQSILQGDSVDQAADRLMSVAEMEMNAALRNARTMITGAQNAGREDTYKEAEKLGINLKKKWRSTLDDRTRHEHRLLDGMVVKTDEPFIINGEEIMYPGDPSCGDPSLVYNCRCCLESVIEGFEGRHVTSSPKMGGKSYEEWKYKDQNDKKKHLVEQIGIMQGKINDLQKHSYSGIWYNQTVTPMDYEDKKDSIDKKKQYYEDQIAKGVDPATQAKYEQYLKDLDEFEKLGKECNGYMDDIYDKQMEVNDITKQQRATGAIPDDTFSQDRKDAALWFDDAAGGFWEADKYLDPSAVWLFDNEATRDEFKAFYRYTEGSGGFNRPLAGYQKPYAEWGSGWEEKYYVGSGQVNIDYEGQGKNIRELTTLIEKSAYPDDIWLQSGQDYATLEGTLGLPRGSLSLMTDAELQTQLVGQVFEVPQFLSTAVCEGGGGCFNSNPTKWNIYCPAGSEILYASDRGAYGKGENEMILQRGGTYEITRAYWGIDETDRNRRKLFFDLDLHNELGYNKFQQDPNEWKGSKAKYK